MEVNFWKLSQGKDFFKAGDILDSISNGIVYVHKDTKAKGRSITPQAKNFVEAPVGDYFYLTHGNYGIYCLGQFTGPANLFSAKGEGWLDRPFRYIKSSLEINYYEGRQKHWTPNDNSTFIKVPAAEISLFEEYILQPHFDFKLADFGL
ncbi:hypothetical protein OKW21_005042 [Catalinimonas alkaloidigena]|uniref:hypothetical protein n=1 Tax=Catalinimonas alkaloidigena TaxID=1075417 RepID=UPI0024055808|nr:hypothetical protein [Catalinimonas alkaloidigena]MDF9799779.1 hypothetical protein [Catalinimonas alkaloidigena]